MKRFLLVAIAAFILFVGFTVQAADQYWVAFTGFSVSGSSAGLFLMKIDSNGRILLPPTPVITSYPVLFSLNAITNGDPGQLLFIGIGADPKKGMGPGVVQTATIDINSLTPSGVTKFPILPFQGSATFSLGATQNVPNKLIALPGQDFTQSFWHLIDRNVRWQRISCRSSHKRQFFFRRNLC